MRIDPSLVALRGAEGNNSSSDTIESLSMRQLTFLRTDDAAVNDDDVFEAGEDSIAWLIGYIVLAMGFLSVFLLKIRIIRSCPQFCEWNAIRLTLPFVNVVLCLECITLAIATTQLSIASQWAIALYLLEATIAPGLFLATFVLVFLSYRNRSLPFCLVHRGPARNETFLAGATSASGAHHHQQQQQHHNAPSNDADEELRTPLVRPATLVVLMRLFSLFLFCLTLVVNFDVVWSEEDLAGRTGWATVVRGPWDSAMAHITLGLIPMALTSCFCLYFSLLLWRHGSFYSMKIYPSVWNPWMSMVWGTAFLTAGQCFGPMWFPMLSNAGILLYQLCVLRIMYEVRHDLKHTLDFGSFLGAISNDQVTGSVMGVEVATTTVGDSSEHPAFFLSSNSSKNKLAPSQTTTATVSSSKALAYP